MALAGMVMKLIGTVIATIGFLKIGYEILTNLHGEFVVENVEL